MEIKRLKSFKTFASKNKYILIILLIAFSLRVWGFSFGLPYLYNPDEPCYTEKAINFFTGDFNPHWFGHPGSSIIDILFLLYLIYFVIGVTIGHFSNITEFMNLYKTNPTVFYLLGRFATVSFGTISIFVLYKILKKIFNENIALISALILAVSPLHVEHSKLIRTDILQIMLILFSLYFLIQYLESKTPKYIFLASMFFGFSIATKWPSILLIFTFLITLFLAEKDAIIAKNNSNNLLRIFIILIIATLSLSIFLYITRDHILNDFIIKLLSTKNLKEEGIHKFIFIVKTMLAFNIIVSSFFLLCYILSVFHFHFCEKILNASCKIVFDRVYLISLAIVVASFFIIAPFVFFDFFEALRCIIVEARGSHIGATGSGFLNNLSYYIKNTFRDMGGIGTEILLLIGIFFLFKDRKKLDGRHLVFFSFPLCYFPAIAKLPLRWDRWALPLFPFLVTLSSIGLKKPLEFLKTKKTYSNLILFLILLILLFPAIKGSVLLDYKLSQKDTRTVAKEWIEENLPQNSVIAYEHYAPHLHINPRKDFVLLNMDFIRIIYMPLIFYINKNVEYLIITSTFKAPFYKNPDSNRKFIERYEVLENRCEKVNVFSPGEFQPGPEITIYRLPKGDNKKS